MTQPLSELTRLHAELQAGKKVQPYMNHSDPLVVAFARAADKELPALLERLAELEKENGSILAWKNDVTSTIMQLNAETFQLRTSLAAAERERDQLRGIAENWQKQFKRVERENAQFRSDLTAADALAALRLWMEWVRMIRQFTPKVPLSVSNEQLNQANAATKAVLEGT